MTVICPLANSYLQSATISADAVAELAATRKAAKYSAVEDQYIFQPIAVESLGAMNCDACKFIAAFDGGFLAFLQMTGKLLFRFNAFLFCQFWFNSVLLLLSHNFELQH